MKALVLAAGLWLQSPSPLDAALAVRNRPCFLQVYFSVYDKAAQIAKMAHQQGLSLRAAAMASGHVTAEQFDAWVRPQAMTGEK